MQKRLEVTLMDKQTGPKGFLVVLPGEIIEIPQDSDKSWLTLFYSKTASAVHKRIAKIANAYEDYVTAEYQKYLDK